MGKQYKERIADRLLARKLAGKGAVLLDKFISEYRQKQHQ